MIDDSLCCATHEATGWRLRQIGLPETSRMALMCVKPLDHDGPHLARLPSEAGRDAGKPFLWPRER